MFRSRRRRLSDRLRQLRVPIGCGIDVVELAQFRRVMARGGTAFLRRVFTARETAYARAHRKTTALHLAARFAAKEAVIKAMAQVDPERVLAMKQVEVRNDRLGRPRIVLHGGRLRQVQVHISLSHVETVAIASAIAINFASQNLLSDPKTRMRN